MPEQILIRSEEEAEEYLRDPKFREMLRRERWYQGDLSHTLRPHGQTDLFDFVERRWEEDPGPRPFVVETHRRFGKSHWLLIRAVQRCLRWPNQRFVYGLPTQEDWKDIGVPNLSKVLEGCPDELRPEKSGFEYKFRNPRWGDKHAVSTLTVAGVNGDKNAGRGGGCDEACADEAGYINHLRYWCEDVVGPQFDRRFRPTFIMSSTPPESMAHPFIVKYCKEAIAFDRYRGVPGSENPDFTEEDARIMEQSLGPRTSIAWQREIEIKHITDPNRMIVPEFIAQKGVVVEERERPTWFFPRDVADLGYVDHTHVLFTYVDFTAQVLVIEDEIWTHYTTPGELSKVWLKKDHERWSMGPDPSRSDYHARHANSYMASLQRLTDGDPLVLSGLSNDHGLLVYPVVKHDKDATIAGMRSAMGGGKISINPRCKQLIYQLENGIRDDKGKWVRNDELGHCDGVAALGYAVRMAPWNDNPAPAIRRDTSNLGRQYRMGSKKKKDHPLARAFNGDY
jgi:hypothetical protein